MAALGIRCGGCGSSCSFRRQTGVVNARARPCSLMMSSHSRPHPENGALLISRDHRRKDPKFRGFEIHGVEDGNGESRVVADRRLDEWMTASASEIVKSLHQAPLFVQVYERNRDGGGFLNLKTETEVGAEYWDVVRAKWENGKAPVPEGVMFVEELMDYEEKLKEVEVGHGDAGDKTDQIWGIVVQGKGADCGVPACYLLKTTRVSSGLGFCAVYYLLTRVKNFRETAKAQLKKCWLVQSPEDEQ